MPDVEVIVPPDEAQQMSACRRRSAAWYALTLRNTIKPTNPSQDLLLGSSPGLNDTLGAIVYRQSSDECHLLASTERLDQGLFDLKSAEPKTGASRACNRHVVYNIHNSASKCIS